MIYLQRKPPDSTGDFDVSSADKLRLITGLSSLQQKGQTVLEEKLGWATEISCGRGVDFDYGSPQQFGLHQATQPLWVLILPNENPRNTSWKSNNDWTRHVEIYLTSQIGPDSQFAPGLIPDYKTLGQKRKGQAKNTWWFSYYEYKFIFFKSSLWFHLKESGIHF